MTLEMMGEEVTGNRQTQISVAANNPPQNPAQTSQQIVNDPKQNDIQQRPVLGVIVSNLEHLEQLSKKEKSKIKVLEGAY